MEVINNVNARAVDNQPASHPNNRPPPENGGDKRVAARQNLWDAAVKPVTTADAGGANPPGFSREQEHRLDRLNVAGYTMAPDPGWSPTADEIDGVLDLGNGVLGISTDSDERYSITKETHTVAYNQARQAKFQLKTRFGDQIDTDYRALKIAGYDKLVGKGDFSFEGNIKGVIKMDDGTLGIRLKSPIGHSGGGTQDAVIIVPGDFPKIEAEANRFLEKYL